MKKHCLSICLFSLWAQSSSHIKKACSANRVTLTLRQVQQVPHPCHKITLVAIRDEWETMPHLGPWVRMPWYIGAVFIFHESWLQCHHWDFSLQVTSLPGSEHLRLVLMKQSSLSWNKPRGNSKCRKLVGLLFPHAVFRPVSQVF